MKIARSVGNVEQRFDIEMQRGMSERRQVDQGRVAVRGLQSQREVDGYGGGSAAALGVDNGEYLSARTFF